MNGSLDLAALADIDHLGAVEANGLAAGRSLSVAEGDITEVGERNERGALLEVLDDPFGVLSAEGCGGGGCTHRLGDGLAVGGVLDLADTLAGRGAGARDGDGIAGLHGDTAEVVGDGGVPLVPSVVALRNSAARGAGGSEVDTGLEDGLAIGVTVDADPGGGGPGARARGRGGRSDGGDGELSRDAVEGGTSGRSSQNSARPVGGVARSVCGVGGSVSGAGGGDQGVSLAALNSAASSTLRDGRAMRAGKSRSGQEGGGDDAVLHFHGERGS